MTDKNKSILAHLGLFYAAAAWGSTFFLIRDAVASTNPLIVTSYRFLISAAILGIYLYCKKINLSKDWKYGLGLSLLVLLIYGAQAIGLQSTSATNSGFITGLFVAFVPIFSWIIYRKRPEFNKFLAVIIAIIGLYILTGGLNKLNTGDLITLITAITYGLHTLLVGVFVKKIDPVIIAFQQFLFTGTLCAAIVLISGGSFTVTSTSSLFIILYLALIPTLSALVIQFISQKYISPIKAAVIMSFEPVFASIFSWTIGQEDFSITQAIGGIIIFLAIIISEIKFRKTTIKG